MHKRITNVLLSLLVLAVSAQSFYLFKTVKPVPLKTPVHREDKNKVNTDQAKTIKRIVKDLDDIKKQLTEEEVKLNTQTISQAVQQHAFRSSVSIVVTAPITPYEKSTNWSASGVVINKKEGYIFTNRHVISNLAIGGACEVKFFDGTQLDAQVFISDPWLDITVLKVDPHKIPKNVTEGELSDKPAAVNDTIFIVSNSDGNSHATDTGRINNVEKILRSRGEYHSLPQGDIAYSTRTVGGSSGSAVFNTKGKIVSLNHSGGTSHGLGCDLAYLHYIKSFINKKEVPVRKHMGAILYLFPLADFIKFSNLPEQELNRIKNQLPQGCKNLIRVEKNIKGTPAEKLLKPGDIIYTADKQVIGGKLAKLDLLMSKAESFSIALGIYRQGKYLEINVPLYNMYKHNIKKVLYFGGAYWFEADDIWACNLGMATGSLTFYKVEAGKTFSSSKYFSYERFYSVITHLNGEPVATLDALIALIPKLVKQKNFNIDFTNPWQNKYLSFVSYNVHDPNPIVYIYNPKKLKWDIKKIGI